MATQDLNKYVTNLMKNYTKCPTGLHPPKGMICGKAENTVVQ